MDGQGESRGVKGKWDADRWAEFLTVCDELAPDRGEDSDFTDDVYMDELKFWENQDKVDHTIEEKGKVPIQNCD